MLRLLTTVVTKLRIRDVVACCAREGNINKKTLIVHHGAAQLSRLFHFGSRGLHMESTYGAEGACTSRAKERCITLSCIDNMPMKNEVRRYGAVFGSTYCDRPVIRLHQGAKVRRRA